MQIVIPGDPIPQIRMKHTTRNGFSRVYDPKAKQKKQIRLYLQQYAKTMKSPRISFIFHMPIPSSISAKDKLKCQSGLVRHLKKPDVDNLIKLYLDCMTGIMFEDDSKVSLGFCLKLYHPEPKTVIILQETDAVLECSLPEYKFVIDHIEGGCCKQSFAEMVYPDGSYDPNVLVL